MRAQLSAGVGGRRSAETGLEAKPTPRRGSCARCGELDGEEELEPELEPELDDDEDEEKVEDCDGEDDLDDTGFVPFARLKR